MNKRKEAKKSSPPVSAPPATRESANSITTGRKWLYRLIAVTVVPLILIAGAELVLRVAGYGYPTRFLIPKKIKGQDVLVENEKFGFLFFPKGAARSPAPIVIPKAKGSNTFRIFLFGESAALGDPKPAFGFGRYLQVLLNERYPGTQFEVVCAAMTGINSHTVLPIARECSKYNGDLWIVYIGNNEMIGPFGASGVFGERTPGTGFVRTVLQLKRLKLGQLLDSISQSIKQRRAGKEWKGLKMFVGHQVAPDDPARQRVADNFRANLEDILQAADQAGVKVIASSVASNLKECAPHASMHSSKMSESAKGEWEKHYRSGILQSSTNCSEAIKEFRLAASLDPEYAELQFRLGRCLAAETNLIDARRAYELARDYDALAFRTTSALNQITRETAEKHKTVSFFDAEKILSESSTNTLPGNDLFFDHVHFNFNGNYRVARLFADEITKALPENITKTAQAEWSSIEQCERRLGLTDWNRYLAVEMMLTRLSDAPYTNQLDNVETRRRHLQKLAEFRKNVKEGDRSAYSPVYEEALSKNPDDYYLHQNFAEYLELSGKIDEAIKQWKSIEELIPQHPIAFFQEGRLLLRQEKFAEAETALKQAVAIRSDFPDALVELGRALAGQKRYDDAMTRYRQALRFSPENAPAHFQMARSLIALEKQKDAVEHLREAIRLRPNYWEAHYLFGVQLAERQQFVEAAGHFREVTRIQPDFAGGHFNLGVGLAKLNQIPEAAVEFEKTLKLDPRHQAAQTYLQQLRTLQNK